MECGFFYLVTGTLQHKAGGIFMKNFSLIKSLTEIGKHPSTIAGLIGVIILVVILLRTKKIKFTTKLIAQIGIVLALSTVLHVFKITELPNGGSITLGSMIPILLISIVYGPEVGFLTGFMEGLIVLILNPYILQPVQVIFDYPLPYMMLGLAGYFKGNKYLATVIATLARFVCHYISGVVFFASYAPKGMSPYIYSFVYNGSFLGIDLLICLGIMFLLPISQLTTMMKRNTV